jgi:predicted amino acid-binding ACT domain protein
VEFAGKYKVKLRVLSSFEDPDVTSPGTLITFEEQEDMEQAIISGIAFQRDEAKITLMGVEDRPGIAAAILGSIAAANIDVDMIVQNIGASGHTDFSFTVNRNELAAALDVLKAENGNSFRAREIVGDGRIAKVSLVGIGMRSHVGIASRMFKALADENINIQMISTSEIKISVIIDEKYLELAVRVLHRSFELEKAQGELVCRALSARWLRTPRGKVDALLATRRRNSRRPFLSFLVTVVVRRRAVVPEPCRKGEAQWRTSKAVRVDSRAARRAQCNRARRASRARPACATRRTT